VILVIGVFNTQAWALKEEPSSNSMPNIIIVMADDLDSRQLSCYGGMLIQRVSML
jgi:hypothetical protein